MERPSDRELFSKVNDALAAISSGKYQFLVYKHLVSDLEELGVTDEKELIDLVAKSLREILAARPANCWTGGRPPARSYEPEIKNLELWAFAWNSAVCGRRMYLKFAIKRDVFIYVDCHADRP
jgi:hypothetical protein